MKIFSVYDDKAKAYLPVFQSATIGTAIRAFTQAANEEESPFYKNAADYTLFMVAEIDQDTGVVTPEKTHTNLGKALQYIEPELPFGEATLTGVK